MKIIKELISGVDKSEYPITDISKGAHNTKATIIGTINIIKSKTKTAKDYYLINISDDTGKVSFPAWENTDFFKFLDESDNDRLVEVQGTIKVKGRYLNIEAANLSFVEREAEDIKEIEEKKGLPTLEELKEQINKRILKINNPFLRNIVVSAIKDLGNKVELAPFTEKTAYNYKGGLLHEIIDMCDVASSIVDSINCSFWNESTILDEDLLLAGAILSNLGKTITLMIDENGIVNKTFEGNLDEDAVYSRDITLRAIEKTLSKIEKEALENEAKFNKDEYSKISTELLHIVSSVKNNQTWGALSTPRSKHAIILSHINNIVYTKGLYENLERNKMSGQDFTKAYNNGRNYYIGNILE